MFYCTNEPLTNSRTHTSSAVWDLFGLTDVFLYRLETRLFLALSCSKLPFVTSAQSLSWHTVGGSVGKGG